MFYVPKNWLKGKVFNRNSVKHVEASRRFSSQLDQTFCAMIFSICRGRADDAKACILGFFFIIQPEKSSLFRSPLLVLIIAFTFMVPVGDPAERQLSWDSFPAFPALCANLNCLPSLPCQCHQWKNSTRPFPLSLSPIHSHHSQSAVLQTGPLPAKAKLALMIK